MIVFDNFAPRARLQTWAWLDLGVTLFIFIFTMTESEPKKKKARHSEEIRSALETIVEAVK